MKWQYKIIAVLIFSLSVVGMVSLTGCDSGGGNPTSPGGTATLQGQILREPAVQISSFKENLWERLWAGLRISEAQAANQQPVPASNMQVSLSVNGQSIGKMMTDSYGRFRFDEMPSGMYELMIQDSNERYFFNHSMSMGMGDMMAAYGVMWMNGDTIQMTWDHQSGDHWDDMMNGVPGSRWDMDRHRMM